MASRFQSKRLSKTEERELFRQLVAGEVTKQQVVESFLYLIPANMSKYNFQNEDLQQEGVLALYRAVEGFDPSRNLRFCTYASHWLRQAAFGYMYGNGSTVRIPVYMRKLMNRISRGQDPGDATPNAIQMAQQLLERSTSCLSDVNDPVDDSAAVEVDELTPVLRQKLNELPERERRLVKQRFMQGRTLSSISIEEGVSVERVRQIIQRAIPKLRCPELESLL